MIDLPIDPETVKGFLHPEEGEALFRLTATVAAEGPCLEIGSYCGKSALYLGSACKQAGTILFSIDHHRGSEEHQPGWDYFDARLWDEAAGMVDTLPALRRTLRLADLEGVVVPIVGNSASIAAAWKTPLSFLFIDGSHTLESALNDYYGWSPHIRFGGMLAIHDVFPRPEDGGRAPYEIYRRALDSGDYSEVMEVRSLRILVRQ